LEGLCIKEVLLRVTLRMTPGREPPLTWTLEGAGSTTPFWR